MKIINRSSVWWGPPRKFSTQIEERKVSWMELFYDLVYVIVISIITHHLAENPGTAALLDYIYFFIMIYWGWLNGSLHHDLHGTEGFRTRVMTMWQMMIVAALAITINTAGEDLLRHATIALMVMQVYITYMWWSVGIYDKAHRRLNRPYTVLYLSSFVIMLITLFIQLPFLIRILFFITLVLNYIPPFAVHLINRDVSHEFGLSPSMSERMGLFTIIMFGEVVAGVVNGASRLHQQLNFQNWVNFGLAVIIVFSLWWLFFTTSSDRKCKSGFVNSSLLQIVYIPTLMSLGLIGAGFYSLFENFANPDMHFAWIIKGFKLAMGIFFLGVSCIMSFLEYPGYYIRLIIISRWMLLVVSVVFFVLAFIELHVSLFMYLLIVSGIILTLILTMNTMWYTNYSQQVEVEDAKQME